LVVAVLSVAFDVERTFAVEWTKLVDDHIGPRLSPYLFWSPAFKTFVLVGGVVSHEHKEPRPYDVVAFDAERNLWLNELPPGAESRGDREGPVTEPGFATPYFELADRAGFARPHPHHALLGNQAVYAPWDGTVYALVCGRTLRYLNNEWRWIDLEPANSPATATRSYKESLNWGAMCADPVNREIVLFGGCGFAVDGGSPGTWVYSPEKNTWRKLELDVEPSSRALSPMVFDPVSKKILLFGGDGLDHLKADTWLYDPVTRTWEERKPAVGPSPRFGHAFVSLPKSGKLMLVGGNGYTSSTSYQAMLYRRLPIEIWSYDVPADSWSLVSRTEQGGPQADPVRELAAAVNDRDELLVVTTRRGNQSPPATWRCRLDTATPDPASTGKYGVKPGTVEYRTGPYDPAWYDEDVPPPDPTAFAALLEKLPLNRWTPVEAPKWPTNRMGGGWSTVAFDSDRDQILHLGGGHSSYFGNDVAHFDLRTGRWSIACRPQFALNYNYDLSGPGPWSFNDAPWGNHNYRAYTYDPISKRLIYLRGPNHSLVYDPARRTWPTDERLTTPWPVSKYTSVTCPTPSGIVAWVLNPGTDSPALFRLEQGRGWTPLTATGDKLPPTETDGSTLTYDARRDQLYLTTSNSQEPLGQVWAYEPATGRVTKLNPTGMTKIEGKRFAREAVYIPDSDCLLMGYLVEGRMPTYDAAANAWLLAELPGSEFISRTPTGASVDLGLAYDAQRKIVWAVMCQLKPGAIRALRFKKSELEARPLQ
jgi:hypothetical protein